VIQAAIRDTDANILLVQEPPLLNGTPPNLDDFHCFPAHKEACQTVTYVRKKAFKSTSVISDPHADFLVHQEKIYFVTWASEAENALDVFCQLRRQSFGQLASRDTQETQETRGRHLRDTTKAQVCAGCP